MGLSNKASGDLFYKKSRKCKACGQTVEQPDRVVWGGPEMGEYHRCANGTYGLLEPVNPPAQPKNYNKDDHIWKETLG